jgi:hypothetical protein
MPFDIDRNNWSGDGDLTQAILDAMADVEQVALVRVEDAQASRADVGCNLLANEIHVGFRQRRTLAVRRILGFLPVPWVVVRPSLTLVGLEQVLSRVEAIGQADYGDEGMLQYLRSQRVIPPYQTRGPKLVELVRIYQLSPVFPNT